MASINRRERKKMSSKKAIIDAAAKLFSQKGYNETSIAEIMNEADLGIGTFYNYFGCKEDILKYFLNEIISETNKFYVKLSKQSKLAPELLREMSIFTGKILDKNRFVLPLLFLAAQHKSSAAKPSDRPSDGLTFKTIFHSIIKAGQEEGQFRTDVPAEVITEMFHAVFQSAAFSSLDINFVDNIAYKLNLIVDGLTVKKY